MHTFYEIEQFEVLELYDSKLVLGDIRISRIDLLSALFPGNQIRERLLDRLQMTEKEELFAKFFSQAYNKGKDIDSMSFPELDGWIRELEEIVFEAKATLQGATQARRERDANLKQSEREKLRDPNYTGDTDAIAAVKRRKDRMSKRDKLFEMYTKSLNDGGIFGMSHEEANKLIDSNISVNEDTQSMKNQINKRPLSDPDGSIQETAKEETKKSLLDKITESVLNAADKPKDKPFDASSLFG